MRIILLARPSKSFKSEDRISGKHAEHLWQGEITAVTDKILMARYPIPLDINVTHCLYLYSSSKRHQPETEENTSDSELRFGTVRTPASAIIEFIRSGQRAERRTSTTRRQSRFLASKHMNKKLGSTIAPAAVTPTASKVTGARRKVYVNHVLSVMRVNQCAKPKVECVRNKDN